MPNRLMNWLRTSLLATILLTASLGQTSAATRDLILAVNTVIPWAENAPNFATRREFAEAIEAYWEKFDARVPRLSPTEKEWIETELSSEGERLSRAVNSTEYAIWSLNSHTDLCLNTVRSVLDAMAKEKTSEVEMFYWLKMVNCYNGTDDLTNYLNQAGIPFNDKAGQHLQIPISNVTQHIIVNKVAPMAMAETMEWTLGD